MRHITLIEEAHRLLTATQPTANLEIANPRGKAVETFCHMLSEIRAYGEGLLIADQLPSRLAADVVRNTNLKIVHRLVSDEDRLVVGNTMNMSEEQIMALGTLEKGQAAVFSEGDDHAFIVQAPLKKFGIEQVIPTDQNRVEPEGIRFVEPTIDIFLVDNGSNDLNIRIEPDASLEQVKILDMSDTNPLEENVLRLEASTLTEPDVITVDATDTSPDKRRIQQKALEFYNSPQHAKILNSNLGPCTECHRVCIHRETARKIAAEDDLQEAFLRYILTCVHQQQHWHTGLTNVNSAMASLLPFGQDSTALRIEIFKNLTMRLFQRLGTAYRWPYTPLEQLITQCWHALEQVIIPVGWRGYVEPEQRRLGENFRAAYLNACHRLFDPFPFCQTICPNKSCLYRYPLAPMLTHPWLHQQYLAALNPSGEIAADPSKRAEAWRKAAGYAARRIIDPEAGEMPGWAAAACYLGQKAYVLADLDSDQRVKAAQVGIDAMVAGRAS